ncbi:hypothetical protein [Amycolatopsis suaedae]|uniref:Uncharacterized protein n=1 Tax=Amycolatopsis suaedae TaxID=2510978 RepID=A0A4Q7J4X5_9PSEU|nr:hypothetical protein [Amycolatopsis suaedae]RZQ62109.1 hypothetical protein EWH70_21235 [Amycolatopsis suaedae]
MLSEKVERRGIPGCGCLGALGLLLLFFPGVLIAQLFGIGVKCSIDFPRGGACDPSTQTVVAWWVYCGFGLGLATLVAAFVIGYRRSRGTGIALVFTSLVIAFLTLVIVAAIVSEEPSAEDQAWSRARQEEAEIAEELAEARTRPPLEDVLSRMTAAREAVARSLHAAVPDVAWPPLYEEPPRPCFRDPAVPGRVLVNLRPGEIHHTQLITPGSRAFTEPEMRAIERSYREALAPAGFAPRPAPARTNDHPTIHYVAELRDHHGGWLELRWNHSRLTISFSTACHLPQAQLTP